MVKWDRLAGPSDAGAGEVRVNERPPPYDDWSGAGVLFVMIFAAVLIGLVVGFF